MVLVSHRSGIYRSAVSNLIQLKRLVTRLKSCTACPDMRGPVVTGRPVMSPVMLIGQAPGNREGIDLP